MKVVYMSSASARVDDQIASHTALIPNLEERANAGDASEYVHIAEEVDR